MLLNFLSLFRLLQLHSRRCCGRSRTRLPSSSSSSVLLMNFQTPERGRKLLGWCAAAAAVRAKLKCSSAYCCINQYILRQGQRCFCCCCYCCLRVRAHHNKCNAGWRLYWMLPANNFRIKPNFWFRKKVDTSVLLASLRSLMSIS
jgi:hypothetical protein